MSRFAAIVLVLAAAFVPAAGATVRVHVVDRDGHAMQEVRVVLEAIELDAGTPGNVGPPFRATLSGPSGLATFADVSVGRYRVRTAVSGGAFVDPSRNPHAPPASLTVDDPDAEVELKLELHRGTPLCARFTAVGAWRELHATLYLRDVESAANRTVRLAQDTDHCEPLPDGRWRASLEAPSGYLLDALEVDGRDAAGSSVEIDAFRGSPSRFVTFVFVAPSRLSGRVTVRGDRFAVAVRARLVEPDGAWYERAAERGGSRFTPVDARPDRLGEYTMDLPAGVWLVQPHGDGLEGFEPEPVRIALAPGDHERIDFEVWGEAAGPGSLLARATTPGEGRPEGRIVVELWPLDEARRADGPLQRTHARAGGFGFAYFSDVAAGDYLLAAAHPQFREGSLEVTGFDPDEREPPRRVIPLREAARVDVSFVGEHDPAGAEVVARRIDGERQTIVADERILAAVQTQRAGIDATGRAALRGLYPGEHRVTAHVSDGLVELRADGEWADELTVLIEGDQRVELEARIVPAASLRATLHCAGGERLPATVDVRVIDVAHRPAGVLDAEWLEHTVHAVSGARLGGRHHDRLSVGPLEAGSVLVALRPSGFNRWTWAVGGENGAEAAVLTPQPGDPLDAGPIAVDCAPAVRLVPRLPEGVATPSIAHVGRREETFRISGEAETTLAERIRVDRARVDPYPDVVFVRDLPEGDVELRLAVGHRYFLPYRWVELELATTLERGRTVEVALPIEGVGGAIEVEDRGGDAALVRATGEGGVEHRARLVHGRALLGNLAAGPWRVDSCADTACRAVVHSWQVELQPLTTLELSR